MATSTSKPPNPTPLRYSSYSTQNCPAARQVKAIPLETTPRGLEGRTAASVRSARRLTGESRGRPGCTPGFSLCRSLNRPSTRRKSTYGACLFDAMKPHTNRIRIAPKVAPIKPVLCPSWYQPTARPMKVMANAPAIPKSVVRIKPWGSYLSPGVMSLAKTPATKPSRLGDVCPLVRRLALALRADTGQNRGVCGNAKGLSTSHGRLTEQRSEL